MAYEDTDDYKNLKKAAAREAANYSDPGSESMAEFMKRTGTKANRPRATVGGPKIVTKEQMKKAGFDNLRDYLNAQRGLTRRKTDTDIITEGATKLYNEAGVGFKPGVMSPDQIAAAEALTMPNEESRLALSSMRGEYGTMKKGGMVKKMKKGGVVKKMKSGGTVSSASKRADGIAVKGKTKGRFV
jgi:hypothetical protein